MKTEFEIEDTGNSSLSKKRRKEYATMGEILTHIINNTRSFLAEMPKTIRKKKGQFFTSQETAGFMAEMFDLSLLPAHVRILDPGAGSGILSAAIVERLNLTKSVKSIHLTCYETDVEINSLLRDNLLQIKKMSNIPLEYVVVNDDYILSQENDFEEGLLSSKNPPKYDLIIANPPYMKVSRESAVALAMTKIVHGAPNLYFLFAAMSLFNLRPEAEMVYIMPRSWTSGLYFQTFRQYLLDSGKLIHIHLFESRDKVFKDEEVLQETMIVKVRKTANPPERVLVTSSGTNSDFNNLTSISVPYSLIVIGKERYVFLPTNEAELEVISKIHSYSRTLPEEGLKMRTGIVVDFRQLNELRKQPGEHIVPLFHSHHIQEGRVHHLSSPKDYDWIVDDKPSLIQKNKNYVFCKRFTAKEERRRLQCGIYLADDFSEYQLIATQNKLNYIDVMDGTEMDLSTAYGVYALMNSTLFDIYYRVLNGSTQVNSSEVNNIPVPPIAKIKEIGNQLIHTGNLTTENCDSIVMEVAYE